MHSRRSLTPILALLAAVLLNCASAGAAPRLGAVADITWGSSHAEIDREVALLRSTGFTTVRADVSWKGTEPNGSGILNTSWMAELDYAISAARAAGLDVLVPLVAQTPYWASSDPAKYTDSAGRHWNPSYPPSSNAEYARWAAAMASHFAALGVSSFEIYNEPNHKGFWAPAPDAGAYAALLRPAAAAIRQAVPGATIVLGGLSANDYGFLQAIYSAGAGSSFDIVAVHPYSGSISPDVDWRDSAGRWAKDCFCGLQEIRSVMVANGDSAKRVWATEFGWSTTTSQYGVPEDTQARYIVAALNRMSGWPWIERAYVYQIRNTPWRKDDPADWNANLGLVRSDFTPKPALAAVRDWAASAAQGTSTAATSTTGTTSTSTTTGTTSTTTGTTSTTTGTTSTTTTAPTSSDSGSATTTTTTKKKKKTRLRYRVVSRKLGRRCASKHRRARRTCRARARARSAAHRRARAARHLAARRRARAGHHRRAPRRTRGAHGAARRHEKVAAVASSRD